jgi:phospholysine phosphohistidine inorganic pyrophosphate phosphatase
MAARCAAVLFDLDGVFFVGDQAIPGGAETIDFLRKQSVPYHFVTNTTSQSREQLATKLGTLSIPVSAEEILTPIVAAAGLIAQANAEPVAAFLPPESAADLRCATVPEGHDAAVRAVVIGELGEAWTFAQLNRAFRLLMAQPEPLFIALGMSRFWADHDGLTLDTGPFVRALEYATDRTAQVSGKPSASFFRAAARLVATSPDQVVMVGDDVRSDVLAAQEAGLRGVLVRTGKFTEADLVRGVAPDQVLDSIADFPAWWRAQTTRGEPG